jgi:hypothetical protein
MNLGSNRSEYLASGGALENNSTTNPATNQTPANCATKGANARMARQPSRGDGGDGLTRREIVAIVGLVALILVPILASVVLPAPSDWGGPTASPQSIGKGGSGSGSTSVAGSSASSGTSSASGSGTLSSSSNAAVSPSFDRCMRDDITGNLFELDSKTGRYIFVRCLDGFNLAGEGSVKASGGLLSVTDSSSIRKLSAEFNLGQQTGSMTASVEATAGVWQVFHINSNNPNPVCQCGA